MKKIKNYFWVIYLFLFLIIFLFLFIKISYLFRHITVNRKNIVGYYAEEENTIDVVLIGGSSTYVYWAPYEAWNAEGIVSYCFSADSMSPTLLKGMIEEASKTQSPQLYIIDLRALDVTEEHPGFYSEAYLRNITDSLKYSKVRNQMIKYSFNIEQPQLKYDIAKYIDFCMYHSLWQDLKEINYAYRNNDVVNENKGFHFTTDLFHEKLERRDYTDVEYELPLSEQTNQILIDLLDYCKDNDVRALFTLNPIYQDKSDTKARYNYIERIVNEYGYEFLDTNEYYDEMGIDFTRDFYHRDHVNLYGAEKYTHFLANYIRNEYNISDRRQEEAYSSWYEGYDKWKAASDEHKKLIDENTVL